MFLGILSTEAVRMGAILLLFPPYIELHLTDHIQGMINYTNSNIQNYIHLLEFNFLF